MKNLQTKICLMKHLMYKNHFSLKIEAGSYSKNYKSSEISGADPCVLLRAIGNTQQSAE